MLSLTLVVPSYQRRGPLERLLRAVAGELRAEPDLCEGFDVVVVLDGSTDGSAELVESLDFPVPLRSTWQPNAGPAAARNRGLREAEGELIWFLDDDMEPGEGLVARHRRAHRTGKAELVMGACLIPENAKAPRWNRSWADRVHRVLSESGTVDESGWAAFANLSGPRRLLVDCGGFDETFTGWGGEDVEFAIRLMQAEVTIRYEPEAVAWHHQSRGIGELCRTKVDEGRNLVHLLELHPEVVDEYLPTRRLTRVDRFLASVRPRSAWLYALLARLAVVAAWVAERLHVPRSGELVRLATTASTAAGIASIDRDRRYLRRFLAPSGA